MKINFHCWCDYCLPPPVRSVDEVQQVGSVFLTGELRADLVTASWCQCLSFLPFVNMFVFDLVLRQWGHSRARHLLLLVLEDILDAGARPRVHHVCPVFGRVGR